MDFPAECWKDCDWECSRLGWQRLADEQELEPIAGLRATAGWGCWARAEPQCLMRPAIEGYLANHDLDSSVKDARLVSLLVVEAMVAALAARGQIRALCAAA